MSNEAIGLKVGMTWNQIQDFAHTFEDEGKKCKPLRRRVDAERSMIFTRCPGAPGPLGRLGATRQRAGQGLRMYGHKTVIVLNEPR